MLNQAKPICAISFTFLSCTPAVAQGTSEASSTVSGSVALMTWIPFLALIAVFLLFTRNSFRWKRRCDDHMNKVEHLLERIAMASERDGQK